MGKRESGMSKVPILKSISRKFVDDCDIEVEDEDEDRGSAPVPVFVVVGVEAWFIIASSIQS